MFPVSEMGKVVGGYSN